MGDADGKCLAAELFISGLLTSAYGLTNDGTYIYIYTHRINLLSSIVLGSTYVLSWQASLVFHYK